jgi:hypothetical protein
VYNELTNKLMHPGGGTWIIRLILPQKNYTVQAAEIPHLFIFIGGGAAGLSFSSVIIMERTPREYGFSGKA